MGLVYDTATTTTDAYIHKYKKYICIFYCIRMRRSWQPPPPTNRNFVRTGAKRGQVVYEQPPTSSNRHPFTGYTGVAADYLRRQQENEERARQSNAYEQQEQARRKYREEQERARRWYEQQQKPQSPKRRSKSPPKKRSSSSTSPEPPEGIKRDTGANPGNCKSFKKYPVRPTGDKKTKRKQLRTQQLLFHPDKNTGCPLKATEKMKVLHTYKDQDSELTDLTELTAGGKSRRVSKRASKRTTKKRSGK